MPTTKPIAPFAAGPICSMAGLVAAAQLIAAIVGYGYWFDEMYMVAIGRHHLAWGSADQPPLTPAIAALVDTIFPNSVVELRIPVIVATAGCVVIAGLIARELGVDGYAQRFDLPHAFSTTRSYGYFDPPQDDHDVVLFIGSDPARWRPYFGQVTQVGEVSGELKAWLLTERRQGWDVLWPRLRTLRVA